MNNILDYLKNHLKLTFVIVILSVLTISAVGNMLFLLLGKSQPSSDQTAINSKSQLLKPVPIVEEKPKEFKIQLGPQQPGRVITLDYLEATASGQLVVYEDRDGAPGSLIEQAIPPFEAGVFRQQLFILSSSLVTGKSYWVLISTDQGEMFRQQFSVR